ncbi:MAG: leucyl aminopeptidase [Acidobacteriota bacterium]
MKCVVTSESDLVRKAGLMVVILEKEHRFFEPIDSDLRSLLERVEADFEQQRIKRELFVFRSDSNQHLLVFHGSLEKNYNVWERSKIFAARALGYAKDFGLDRIAFLLNGADGPQFIGKVVEGAVLGSYSFEKYKKEKSQFSDGLRLSLLCDPQVLPLCKAKVKRYQLVSEAVNECREIVNEPGSAVYPEVLADMARQLGKKHGLKVTILGEKELQKKGLYGLVSVGKGSIHPPRLIGLQYKARGKSPVQLALVGKGITFDTGGISIKPSERMLEMKGDMAGGAAVLFAMKAVALLKPDIDVTGIIPAAENFPDANAQRPGDILIAKNGKSVQVDNTDAEGRLVLLDGFALAEEMGATHIVDIATLTGAVVRALGQGMAGIMGNDQELIQRVIESGQNHGEVFWQLPLPDEYREMLKTPYADINNVGGPKAGAITAGLFLKEFIPEDTAWAHLDIAGPFLLDRSWKYYKEGATGFGVKTFVDLCERFTDYFPQAGS